MTLLPRHKIYLGLSVGIFMVHLGVAAVVKPSFSLTIVGDTFPCLLLVIALLATRENFARTAGLLPLYWKVTAAGILNMFLSQAYWFYYDSLRRYSTPSPVPGDSLFLLAHVFFLSALALRPHAASAGRELRIRWMDFGLLTLWWFTLYGYFSLPWQAVVRDFSKYNPTYYVLALIQHVAILIVLAVLWLHNRGAWRRFYGNQVIVFVLITAANLILSVSIDRGVYSAGSFYDTPFLLAVVGFTYLACLSPGLEPTEGHAPNRELSQSLWTARIAMIAILTLPVIALCGYFERNVPGSVAGFRLRVVFWAILMLGALVFWKLNLLARELEYLVQLSQSSIEKLKSVQARVTQSQKLAALGRLAAGAAHEISNPLTAILGYSELLADIPSLTLQERESAQAIQQQVHNAQAAVNSLRSTLRNSAPAHPIAKDQRPSS
jgi:His Kinase A (phospho-acceptor) domain